MSTGIYTFGGFTTHISIDDAFLCDLEILTELYGNSGKSSKTRMVSFERPSMIPEMGGVIFNMPATIVWWKDGSKTIVKCREGDTYSEEAGLRAAYLKKMFGSKTLGEVDKCISKYFRDKAISTARLTLIEDEVGVE